MSYREKTAVPIANLFIDSNPALRQVKQGAADLKLFKRAWNDIIPGTAYSYIRPAFYADGKLTVWVESPVWANWIRHRQQSIISCIHDCELPRVHTLIIRLSPQHTVDSTDIQRPDIQHQPHEKTSLAVSHSARAIADPELRKSLERLAKTLKIGR